MSLNLWMLGIIAVDLVLVIGAIIVFRFLVGVFVGVNVKEELDNKDNLAFGLTLAGGVAALCLILSAAISGEASAGLTGEAANVISFALVGIVLLKIGVLINDQIFLRGFSVPEKIREKNVAVGTVQAANLLAVGILINSSVNWVEIETWHGITAVVLIYFAGQIVLSAVTAIRINVYKFRHETGTWKNAIADGNTALAIRYAGHIIGTAIAGTAVAALVNFIPGAIVTSAAYWLGLALGAMILLWVLYKICISAILPGVNIVEEVDNQKNAAIAFIEASLFIGIALIIRGILA